MTDTAPTYTNGEEVNSEKKHDFVYQFICAETGNRSECFLSNWTELAEILRLREQREDAKPTDKDYILLVAVMDGEQTHIPTSPLITVETYLNNVNPEK